MTKTTERRQRPGYCSVFDPELFANVPDAELRRGQRKFIQRWHDVLRTCRLTGQDPRQWCVYWVPGATPAVFVKREGVLRV